MSIRLLMDREGPRRLDEKLKSCVIRNFTCRFPSSSTVHCFTIPRGWIAAFGIFRIVSVGSGTENPCVTSLVIRVDTWSENSCADL